MPGWVGGGGIGEATPLSVFPSQETLMRADDSVEKGLMEVDNGPSYR